MSSNPYENRLQKVILRPFRQEDFPMLASIKRDEAAQHLLMAYPTGEPVTDEDVSQWIDRRLSDPNGSFRVIADINDTESYGFAQVTNIHHKGRHGYCGLALAPNARGRGIGYAGLSALSAHARELGLIKLLGIARADNAISLRFCDAVGYVQVGLLRQHYLGVDAIMLENLL